MDISCVSASAPTTTYYSNYTIVKYPTNTQHVRTNHIVTVYQDTSCTAWKQFLSIWWCSMPQSLCMICHVPCKIGPAMPSLCDTLHYFYVLHVDRVRKAFLMTHSIVQVKAHLSSVSSGRRSGVYNLIVLQIGLFGSPTVELACFTTHPGTQALKREAKTAAGECQ